MHALDNLFEPRNVAVIGASQDPGKQGHKWFHSLIRSGYQGKVFAVNPRGGEIHGHRVYRSIDEIDAVVDLVFTTLSPEATEDAILQAAERGVPFGLVFAAGFAEMGVRGAAAQEALVAKAHRHGMRLVGPNSMGIFNLNVGLNLKHDMQLPVGPVAILSQSGNVMLSLWHEAMTWNIGFSKAVHFGNQADIPAHEYLEYLGLDSNTEVIVLYVEGLVQGLGQEFLRVATAVAREKPIVALKGGRSVAGTRAAASHTAALAGEERAYSAAFRQAGIIEVERFDELLPVAETLYRCPPMRQPKLAVVGSGGGHSVMAVDALERRGLDVPRFSPATQAQVAAALPPWAPSGNPIDMTGAFMEDLSLYSTLTQVALDDQSGLGGALAYGLYGLWGSESHRDRAGRTYETAASMLGDVQSASQKPIVFYSPYARVQHPSFLRMRQSGVPCFDSIDVAARCLRALYDRWLVTCRSTGSAATLPSEPTRYGGGSLRRAQERRYGNVLEPDAYKLLSMYGVPVVPHRLASSLSDALKAAAAVGYPVVLKIVAEDIVHKTDVGGVAVNLRDDIEFERAYMAILERCTSAGADEDLRVLVTKYYADHVEVLVGVSADATFGRIMVLGLGGVFAEALDDVAACTLPVSLADIDDMIARIRGRAVLLGTRGRPPVDLSALRLLASRLAQIVELHPEIVEVDLNPVLASAAGVIVADARIIVASPDHVSLPRRTS